MTLPASLWVFHCLATLNSCEGRPCSWLEQNRTRRVSREWRLRASSWSSWSIQHPALQVHAQARRGILALLEARHPIHVLSHPVWSALLSEWQDPHSQHDVAEFASFAASALLVPINCMQLHWQSRVTTDTGVEITESGQAVTLGLDLTTMAHPDVQGLLNHWSTQVVTCAFSEPPSLAVSVACSFTGCALPGSRQIQGYGFMSAPTSSPCVQGCQCYCCGQNALLPASCLYSHGSTSYDWALPCHVMGC